MNAAHWSHVRSAQPCREDLDLNERIVREWASQHGPTRALLLGVTPEIATMQRPTDAELEAVDLVVPT